MEAGTHSHGPPGAEQSMSPSASCFVSVCGANDQPALRTAVATAALTTSRSRSLALPPIATTPPSGTSSAPSPRAAGTPSVHPTKRVVSRSFVRIFFLTIARGHRLDGSLASTGLMSQKNHLRTDRRAVLLLEFDRLACN